MSFLEKPLPARLLRLAACKIYILENFILPLALLATRLYVGKFIWQSGQTKLSNTDTAKGLFRDEFLPNWEKNHVQHILGLDIPFPVPSVDFGTYASMTAELCCSALLVLGLAGRLGAFGIFMLALSIQTFVYPDAPETPYEMLLMALVIGAGPGKISLDHIIRRKLLKNSLCDIDRTKN